MLRDKLEKNVARITVLPYYRITVLPYYRMPVLPTPYLSCKYIYNFC